MQKFTRALAGVCLLTGVLVIAGCSSSPSDEEMKALTDLKNEISAMEGEITKKQRDLGDLEKQLAEQNGRLQQCQSDQEAVKKALGGQ